jgi:hypothetical protein
MSDSRRIHFWRFCIIVLSLLRKSIWDVEFSEGTRKVSDKKITSTWSLFVSSWSPFFCLELFHSDFASRFAARLSEMFLISLRRRGGCQSRSHKFQCGLFRIKALFTSLQPPGHSGFSPFLLFLKWPLFRSLGTCFWGQNQIRTRTGTRWRLYRGNSSGWLKTLRGLWNAQVKS